MPVSAVRSTGDFVELVVGAKATRVNFAVLAPGTHDVKSAELKNLLQGALDKRERRSALPPDDPDGGMSRRRTRRASRPPSSPPRWQSSLHRRRRFLNERHRQ